MTRLAGLLTSVLLISSVTARAQDAPPRIGPFVIDVRGAVPMFPSDSVELAASRGVYVAQLPGPGIGIDVDAHIYLLKWKAITFGIGAEVMAARAHQAPAAVEGQTPLRPVTETFKTFAPQISFNFGSGNGWSYISGGVGRSVWSLVPDGQDPRESDSDPLNTFNYGGGGRWWPKRHLGVSLDVRFWQINPGTPQFGFPGSPRTTLLVLSGGISMK